MAGEQSRKKRKILLIGDFADVMDIFDRDVFSGECAVEPSAVRDPRDFKSSGASRRCDLIVLDSTSFELSVLESVRHDLPCEPVLMVCDPDSPEFSVEAIEGGADGCVLRVANDGWFKELLAREIQLMLSRFVCPPDSPRPSTVDLFRYAQYHNVLHPFMIVDCGRTLRFFNEAAFELNERIGGSALELGEPVETWPIAGSDEQIDSKVGRALSGESVTSDRVFPGLETSPQHREIHYRPVRDDRGDVLAATIAIRLETRPQAHQARKLQALGRLAGGVAHDFNNLLGVVTTCAELIKRKVEQHMEGHPLTFVEENLQKMGAAVERGANLTRQLLGYSEEKQGEAAPTDLNRALHSAKELAQQLIGADIDIVCKYDENLPAVEADPSRFEQILMNLAANARDAMPNGGTLSVVTKRLELQPEDAPPMPELGPGLYAHVAVSDTGVGMPEDVQRRIFEPFYTTKRNTGGTGLGLASVRDIVESLGGHVDVESKPGVGTTFDIYIPGSNQDDPLEK